MKNPILVLLLSFFIGSINAPYVLAQSVNQDATVASPALTHISFPIEGMTCKVGCAARIEKKVAASKGVTASKVDFDSKTAYVTFDTSKTSFDAIRSTIEGLGSAYKVGEEYENAIYDINESGKKCDSSCKKACCANKNKCDHSSKESCKAHECSKEKKSCDKSCDKPCCKAKKESA